MRPRLRQGAFPTMTRTPFPRLLFVVEHPFTTRDEARFGIADLRAHFDVEVLDVTDCRGTVDRHSSHVGKSLDWVRSVDTVGGAVGAIAVASPSVLVSNLSPSALRTRVFVAARAIGAVTVEFTLGYTPGDVRSGHDFASRIRRRVLQARSWWALAGDLVRIPRAREHTLIRPEVRVAAGAAMRARHRPWEELVVATHSHDWDSFLLASQNQHRSEGRRPSIVYLDQEMGYHPDYRVSHLRVPIRPRGFYCSLNRYLRRLEDRSGIEVIVAAHPRADRARLDRRLPRWRVSDQPTVHAVQDASLVLTHNSTAASFAVAWRRPVVVLADRDLLRSWEGIFTTALAEALGAPIDMIDGDAMPSFPSTIDAPRYDEFVRDYLTERPDDRRSSWTITAESLVAYLEAGGERRIQR